MKRIYFFCMAFLMLFCSLTRDKINSLEGKWEAIYIGHDFQVPCKKNVGDKLSLTVYENGRFELFKKQNQNTWVENGICEIDSINNKARILIFKNTRVRWNDSLVFEGNRSAYPILTLKQDSLIIRYNFCCFSDTCDQSSGIVSFIRKRE